MSVKKVIQQPKVSTKETLSDILDAYVTEAVETFPQLKDKFLIVNLIDGRMHHSINPQTVGFKNIEQVEQYVFEDDWTRHIEKEKWAAANYEPDRGMLAILYAMPTETDADGYITTAAKQKLMVILDHELAHVTIPNGYYTYHNGGTRQEYYEALLGEGVADAYATLRSYQRFGTFDDQSLADPSGRALRLLEGSPEEFGHKDHFTAFVVDEIMKRKDRIDFKNMSSEQVVALAWRFAMEYMPPAPVVDYLQDRFGSVVKVKKDHLISEESLKKITELTLSDQPGYYVFKFGNYILRDFLAGKVTQNDKPVLLKGAYWNNVRKKLKELEFKLARDEILLGMPTLHPKTGHAPKNTAPASNQNKIK